MQEHVESDQIEKYIIHQPLNRFFINMHTFHNSHLLRTTLPRDLVAPILLFSEQQEKHCELAANLREKQASRKAAAAKKRKRPEDDGNEEEIEARPRKTQKEVTRKQPKSRALPLPTHSIAASRAR
jgi:hypothetical protein